MRPFKFRLVLGFLIVAVGCRYETASGNNPEYAFLGLGFAGGIVSCLSAANNGAVTDGDYLLTLPGGTVSVFCYGMTSSPVEYLTLPNSLANGRGTYNYSTYGPGGNSSGLTTWYNRIRFYPDTLTVDITDTTFSTSNGGFKFFGSNYFYTNNYAEAGDCVGGYSNSGTANVDLTGLPFVVAGLAQFQIVGALPGGSIAFGATNQIVDLTGGGICGGTAPINNQLLLAWP